MEDLPKVPCSDSATEEHKAMTAFLNGEIDEDEYLRRMDEIFERNIATRRLTGRYE